MDQKEGNMCTAIFNDKSSTKWPPASGLWQQRGGQSVDVSVVVNNVVDSVLGRRNVAVLLDFRSDLRNRTLVVVVVVVVVVGSKLDTIHKLRDPVGSSFDFPTHTFYVQVT
jgi:hypothetical protein